MVSIEDDLAQNKAKFQKLMEYYKRENLSGIQEMTESDETLTMQKHKDLMLNDQNKIGSLKWKLSLKNNLPFLVLALLI